ncbi:hypothetical protein [Psychrobacter sp. LV10R520-6]|nr:hypothetical protein [Psychrobacter sp. LV10R520-6]
MADIRLYAYKHTSSKGSLNLGHYPHLQAWFKRIEVLLNFISEGE